MKTTKPLLALFVAAISFASQISLLDAASTTWNSGSTTARNWTDPTYWNNGVPGPLDDAVMAASVNNAVLQVNTAVSVNSLQFSNMNNNDRLTILTGGSISIASGSVNGTGSLYIQQTNSAVAGSVINADISVGNMQVWGASAGTTAYFTTVSGQDIAATSSALTVGSNTASGNVTLSAGSTLQVQQYLVLTGSGANGATFNLNGGALKIRGTSGDYGIQRSGSAGSVVFNFSSGTITTFDSTSNSVFRSTDTNGATLDIALGNVGRREIFVGTGASPTTQSITQQSTSRFVNQSGVDGGWTKTGVGSMILQGENTYTGDTVVSAGTLVLDTTGSLRFKIGADGVNNQLYDDAGADGKVTLNGAFVFDLAGADTTIGNLWTIVDIASFSGSSSFFGASFSVADFTDAGSNLWTKSISGSTYYQFSELTGELTVVPEPATWAVMVAGLTMILIVRRRRVA